MVTTEPSQPHLLRLPDEILLLIANCLSDGSDLCRLSLVCLRFRHVAQENLVKDIASPKPNLVRTLCRRPCLAEKIIRLNLGNYIDSKSTIEPLELAKVFPGEFLDAVHGLYDSVLLDKIFSSKQDNSLWPDKHRCFLDILVALCRNLTELKVQLPKKKPMGRAFWTRGADVAKPIEPFPSFSTLLLGKHLRILELDLSTTEIETTPWITLSSLSSLTRLTVPLDAIQQPFEDHRNLQQTLPSGLETLRLRPCARTLHLWIAQFATDCFAHKFPRFRHLHLYLDGCLRSIILLLAHDDPQSQFSMFKTGIEILATLGIAISTYDRQGMLSGNVLEELSAYSCLSDLEIWQTSALNKSFSRMVARSGSGAPRKRTIHEISNFLSTFRPRKNFPRLQSCRFNPNILLNRNRVVRFGHDQQNKADVTVWTRLFEVWLSTLPLSRLDLSPNKITETLCIGKQQLALRSNSTPMNATGFAFASIALKEPGLVAKFDGSEWSGVDFFELQGGKFLLDTRHNATKKKCRHRSQYLSMCSRPGLAGKKRGAVRK